MNMEKYFEETCEMRAFPGDCIFDCKNCKNYSPNIEIIRELDLNRPKTLFG